MASRPGTPRGHGSPSPLSIRRFNSTEEYMSVIRNGLSDWLNSLYNLNVTPDDLIEYLSTGVVLCHHANTWEVERGTEYRVHFSPRATQGSFQARDNVSLFINWCRRSLQFPETLLFETNDLVEGRNEHNFLVCLLEVARKGSEVGLSEPVFDLPEMSVEKFATGPLSSIPLSYSDKKVPPSTESKRDSDTTQKTPPLQRRHPQRSVSTPSLVSSDGATGNDVSSSKVTGNNVMMVVRDSHGKHTVLRDRTEPVNLEAKNYQLVCADTVELPTNKTKRDEDATLHVMAAIPANDMEAKPGDEVFCKSTEIVAPPKSCPVHGRSSSLDDVAHGQRPNTPTEKTRATRRWSDGFQTQPRTTGRRDSTKSPSERVLSRVIAAKSSQGTHFESPFIQSERHQHQHVSSPRRGSLGCSVCPKHSNEEESLESFWERLSRPKTRRKSLPSGLPTVSENVTRQRPKSADGRLHARRGTFTCSSSTDQISLSPRGNTWGGKNLNSSLDKNDSEQPRPRPRSAMGKLGPDRTPVSPRWNTGMTRISPDKNGPEGPRPRPRSAMAKFDGSRSTPQNPREKERPINERSPKENTYNPLDIKKETSKEMDRATSFRNRNSKERVSTSPRGNVVGRTRNINESPDRNGHEHPRPRPRSAMAKFEAPTFPPLNPLEKGKNLTGRNSKENFKDNHSLDIRKERPDERNTSTSFPNSTNRERTSRSSRSNTENFVPFRNRDNPETRPRPRSAVAKLEGSPPRQVRAEEQFPNGKDVKEKKTPARHASSPDIRKKTSVEENGTSKASGRIPLERANSFTIKERRAQSESSDRTPNHRRENGFSAIDRSKSLPLIDEVFVDKRQERFVSMSTRPTVVNHSSSESAKQSKTFYPTFQHNSDNRTRSLDRRVSDSYAMVGRDRTEVDREVYEDFLREVGRTKSPSPAVLRRLSPSTVNNNKNIHQQTTTANNINTSTQHHSNTYREANFKQNDETEEAYSSSSDDASPDLKRSGLRPCTPVPSDHKLPRDVSPRQDPVPWPPSRIPRPTFYVSPEETGAGPVVSPSAQCSNAKNLQDFLDYLHTSNALQRSDSVSLTSDSSEGSTLI
ncbi:serine/arginine repetitive matrix protein 1-like [Branchiostoma floridae]|uniref:Serine/arginine repetitive matrix protein 1-like n=1 Tax=Branchiostoma floridae TaxID=7739 RepID=A0A9J7L7J7_BRAFL|nr:serine/arginine repetitive matrix protein 1-like [Branchiostoma floridae]